MIISIMNLKGGVGKTTSTINIAYLAATIKKKKVLVVDNDPQGNASGYFKIKGNEHQLVDVIMTTLKKFNDKKLKLAKITPASTQYKGIDILASDLSLCTANVEMSSSAQNTLTQSILFQTIFESLSKHYDLILIDNAPNITPLAVSALLASDRVIIPVEADGPTIDGMNKMLEQIDAGRDSGYANDLRLGGILFNKFNRRAKVDKETFAALKNGQLTGGVKHRVFDSTIRQTVKVKEATFYKMPLDVYPKSTAAEDYRSLINEIFYLMPEWGKGDAEQ